MQDSQYEAAWNGLTPVQRKAAEWDKGPLLVLAGPGSGKTRVLTCRIARILRESHEQSFRLLALTFTNTAANEMRERVAALSPGEEERVLLGTIHSFCADTLRRHGTIVGVNPNFQIYSQNVDLQAIVDEAIRDLKASFTIVDSDKTILPTIQKAKSRLIFPESCEERCKDREFGRQLAAVYQAYEDRLAKLNTLDFDSLILRTYQLFTQYPAIAERCCRVYPYICLDEFQDTNQAQYQLIRALTRDKLRNVFVVADDDQIIYQWNGASHQRLQQFKADYSASVIQLPMNFRCPDRVVRLANSLIVNNFGRMAGKEPLKAFKTEAGYNPVRLLSGFPDAQAEWASIADDIQRQHADHLGRTVILGRNRKMLDGMLRSLQALSLPSMICQRKDEFESTPLKWLHCSLRLANNRLDRRSLEAVAGTFSQLTSLKVDIDEVEEFALVNNDLLRTWIKLVREQTQDADTLAILDTLQKNLVETAGFLSFSRFAIRWFDSLVRSDGQDDSKEVFASYEDERVAWQNLVKDITSALGRDLSLEAFLQELDMRSKEIDERPDTIRLMTIHGAKGKEADHVYLIGLVEDELPSFQSKRKGDDSPEMEEERRNCFVAITRTCETLTLSYANSYRGWHKAPSRFLSEMGFSA